MEKQLLKSTDLTLGDLVVHPRLGKGRLLQRQPNGKVVVLFAQSGLPEVVHAYLLIRIKTETPSEKN